MNPKILCTVLWLVQSLVVALNVVSHQMGRAKKPSCSSRRRQGECINNLCCYQLLIYFKGKGEYMKRGVVTTSLGNNTYMI